MANGTMNVALDLVETVLFIQYLIIQPFIFLVGFFGNIWILGTFIFRKVSISSVSKFYYIVIAICDFMLMVKTFFWDVLCESFDYYTGGKTWFCLATISKTSCSIMHLWYFSQKIHQTTRLLH